MSSRTSDWAHEVSAVLVDLKYAEVVKVVPPVKVDLGLAMTLNVASVETRASFSQDRCSASSIVLSIPVASLLSRYCRVSSTNGSICRPHLNDRYRRFRAPPVADS
jgi:hypothetical protein